MIKWILFTQSRGVNERKSWHHVASKALFFMSASVELITALEIKMRGSNEGLLEIRNLLAVSAAV